MPRKQSAETQVRQLNRDLAQSRRKALERLDTIHDLDRAIMELRTDNQELQKRLTRAETRIDQLLAALGKRGERGE